jgi:hypothetical protein
MQESSALFRQIEESIRDGTPDQRVVTLRRVTDLFVHRAEQYDDEQVELFDGVIGRLAAEIEKTAREKLADCLGLHGIVAGDRRACFASGAPAKRSPPYLRRKTK